MKFISSLNIRLLSWSSFLFYIFDWNAFSTQSSLPSQPTSVLYRSKQVRAPLKYNHIITVCFNTILTTAWYLCTVSCSAMCHPWHVCDTLPWRTFLAWCTLQGQMPVARVPSHPLRCIAERSCEKRGKQEMNIGLSKK